MLAACEARTQLTPHLCFLQEQIELPEVPSEPLPNINPGTIAFCVWPCWSKECTQVQCPAYHAMPTGISHSTVGKCACACARGNRERVPSSGLA